MPSIAQILIDKYNGIETPAPKVEHPKKGRQTFVMTEELLDIKSEMLKSLQHGQWIVEFTKVNGEDAIMLCTRDPRLLPQSKTEVNPAEPTTGAAAAAEHLIHVYATDRGGWRSFAVPNVKKFYQYPESL